MTNLSFDILFETLHAAIIGTIFFFLLIQGQKHLLHQKSGWRFILAGFGLLFCGTLLDITDNFSSLNRFIVIGDTRYEAFLEKVVGYTLGSVLLAIGFWKFISAVFALQANEERLRMILAMGPISMAIVAMDGTIEYVNQRAIETFGYLPEDIPDMEHWWRVAYPDEAYRAEVLAKWMGQVEKAAVGNKEIERQDYLVTCKDGTVKTMVIFGVLLTDKVFVMFEDISERKLAQEEIRRLNSNLEMLVVERTAELIRSNRDLASFCYAISHELRAPVARLRGLSEALQEELAENPATAVHCAERITVASQQLQRVIDSVLQLSRLSQSSFTPYPLNMSAMVEEITTAMIRENPGRRVELLIAEGVTASGDPALVRLCLENLLGNAMKYSLRQPVTRIEFGRDAVSGALFIRDNGVGFDMKYAEKLFEPFIRLHQEEIFSGSGIGLATVQRIIERHCGEIWAESAPDKGATFSFTLAPAQVK